MNITILKNIRKYFYVDHRDRETTKLVKKDFTDYYYINHSDFYNSGDFHIINSCPYLLDFKLYKSGVIGFSKILSKYRKTRKIRSIRKSHYLSLATRELRKKYNIS